MIGTCADIQITFTVPPYSTLASFACFTRDCMPTLNAVFTKGRAIARRGLPVLRNVVFARLGIWPVGSLKEHWLADVPVYCISLARAVQRRRLMEVQVKNMGLRHFDFVDAVDSRSLTAEKVRAEGLYDSATCLKYHSRDLSMNQIACSLSHAAVYRLIVERAHPWALIVEDDALFRTSRIMRLNQESIPDGIDMLFLNAFLDKTPPLDPISLNVFADTSYQGSTAAYMVTTSAAERLLEAALPVVHAADGLTGRVLALPSGSSHPFRQRGVSLTLSAAIVYPEAVTNGSTEHYHSTTIR